MLNVLGIHPPASILFFYRGILKIIGFTSHMFLSWMIWGGKFPLGLVPQKRPPQVPKKQCFPCIL